MVVGVGGHRRVGGNGRPRIQGREGRRHVPWLGVYPMVGRFRPQCIYRHVLTGDFRVNRRLLPSQSYQEGDLSLDHLRQRRHRHGVRC
jgi:hypothetical protein